MGRGACVHCRVPVPGRQSRSARKPSPSLAVAVGVLAVWRTVRMC